MPRTGTAADALALLHQRHGYNRGRAFAFAAAAARLATLMQTFTDGPGDLTAFYERLEATFKEVDAAARASHEEGNETMTRLDAIRDLAARQAP